MIWFHDFGAHVNPGSEYGQKIMQSWNCHDKMGIRSDIGSAVDIASSLWMHEKGEESVYTFDIYI